ncbi:MAG: Hydrolase, TatD family [Candidatus Azambacteria bacterium GW2011_GWF2_46_32]|uniref:Hydrolase, TatD family n=1 Tax=Candidatus Azambacteria bacterium GW2011_GWF2_46_32 TaxID=1618628 RepID=A0A0G1PYQ8_9BACT|nr:MAG: Hydrolase, TatD family [Candidatus Azambacteria bacterium GW2011_GWF2_46_32]
MPGFFVRPKRRLSGHARDFERSQKERAETERGQSFFRQILFELDFLISFTGVITFVKDWNEVIKIAPLEKIMVETDAPYVAPVPYRGKRNEPLYVEEAAKKIAELKGVSFEEVARQTTLNARALFGI